MTLQPLVHGVTFFKLLGLIVFAVAVIGGLSTPPAWAQQKQKLPALLEIPAATAPNQPSLISRRAALQKEREELRQAFARQNAQCSAVDQRDTAKLASCTERAQMLSARLARHIQDSEAFNRALSLGCVEEISTHGCLGNPPSHILQFHNGCSSDQWVQAQWRWNKTGQCEQGGTERLAPGATGSLYIGLCSQGEFQSNVRACGQPGCDLPACPNPR